VTDRPDAAAAAAAAGKTLDALSPYVRTLALSLANWASPRRSARQVERAPLLVVNRFITA